MEHISKKRVVYEAPGMDAVTVRRNVEFRGADGDVLFMDVYTPPQPGARLPAVIIVTGFPDPGYEAKLGCRFKDMASSVSWGQLIAVSGMAAIAYTNRQPAADLLTLREAIRNDAAIDDNRIGLWASSGNVPLAFSSLMRDSEHPVKCAALYYGYTIDLDGSTSVADAAKIVRFANPCGGRSAEDLRRDIPLFLARAGQDQFAGLNDALDRFTTRALSLNLPLTLVNHVEGTHAFDLFHDSETSREIIRETLRFLQFHLRT